MFTGICPSLACIGSMINDYIDWVEKVLKRDSRSTIHTIHCDPYGPLSRASFPNAEGLFRTAFMTISHSWILGMSVISFRLQFLIQFVPIEEDRRRSFLPRLHWPIFCVLRCQTTAACIIEAVSQLLPNNESRTWDAKTRKLLRNKIVISGEIQYFRT